MTVRVTKAMEDEVNGSLGALLGVLEVLTIDVEEPLTERQQRLVGDALRLGDRVRVSVEAMLTLLSDEADARFSKAAYALRRLVDHAVRAAGWSASEQQVALRLPPSGDWENALLWVDAARTDRALRAMTVAMVAAAGPEGAVELSIELSPARVALVLGAHPRGERVPLLVPPLVGAAWQRLVELQGGRLRLDPSALVLCLELPKATAEELR